MKVVDGKSQREHTAPMRRGDARLAPGRLLHTQNTPLPGTGSDGVILTD